MLDYGKVAAFVGLEKFQYNRRMIVKESLRIILHMDISLLQQIYLRPAGGKPGIPPIPGIPPMD